MGRLISAANFIHSNMPNGTTYDQPPLSVEEAWDVAAYVDSMNRQQKAGLDKDLPVRSEKPADAGYGSPSEDDENNIRCAVCNCPNDGMERHRRERRACVIIRTKRWSITMTAALPTTPPTSSGC